MPADQVVIDVMHIRVLILVLCPVGNPEIGSAIGKNQFRSIPILVFLLILIELMDIR